MGKLNALSLSILVASLLSLVTSVLYAKPQIHRVSLPLSFEANQGQADEQVLYLSRGHGYTLLLTGKEAALVLRGNQKTAFLKMKMEGSNPAVSVKATQELPGKSNYFIGNDSTQWHRNIPHFAKVIYQNIYAGIDLVHHGEAGLLEYDFKVSPGANPKNIQIKFAGAQRIRLSQKGDLVISLTEGNLIQHRPQLYQEEAGIKKEVAGSFEIRGKNRVGFKVAAYDKTKPLVIDPVLSYRTYIGGGDYEETSGIAVDSTGAAYVTGLTLSTDYPSTPGAFQPAISPSGIRDIFVTKLNPDGNALVYSTFLGGNNDDMGFAIAIDDDGNAYVTGNTRSANFPTATPFQAVNNGPLTGLPAPGGDAFVTKLNASGSGLLYSTFLGGGQPDAGNGITVDNIGHAFVAGNTTSPQGGPNPFPLMNAFQGTYGGGVQDAFVTKFDVPGNVLLYSSYLGGSSDDQGHGIATDAMGNAYISGRTASSTDFPTTPGAFQTSYGGGLFDGFLTKVTPDGAMDTSTYFGGSGTDVAWAVAVDGETSLYITGFTNSDDTAENFPTTAGAYDPSYSGATQEGYIAKFLPDINALDYCTYLGGTGAAVANQFQQFRGISVDGVGNAYVSGGTYSTDFPTTPDAFSPNYAGGLNDPVIAKLNFDGSRLLYSTYLGSANDLSPNSEFAFGVALDHQGGIYITGRTNADDFPTSTGSFQETKSPNGLNVPDQQNMEVFVAKVEIAADLEILKTASPTTLFQGETLTYTLEVTNHGPSIATGVTFFDNLISGIHLVSAVPSKGSCNTNNPTVLELGNLICEIGDLDLNESATIVVVVIPDIVGEGSNTATVEGIETDPDSSNNSSTTIVTVVATSEKILEGGGCSFHSTASQNYSGWIGILRLLQPNPRNGLNAQIL